MKKHFYFSQTQKEMGVNMLLSVKHVKVNGVWIEYTFMSNELRDQNNIEDLPFFIQSDYVYLGCHDEWAIKINGVMQGNEQINAILTDDCNAKINNKAQGDNMKKHKLIPVNLTAETFIQRTMAGETVRDADENEYKYLATFQTPFRVNSRAMTGYNWGYVPNLFTRVDLTWRDEVSETNPVLCWVSDDYAEKKFHAVLISYYGDGINFPYQSLKGIVYKYATPVEKKECYK